MTGPHIPPPLGEWGPESKCANDDKKKTEWFFPFYYFTNGRPSQHVQDIRAYCSGCPMRRTCLEHGVYKYEEDGMWGGTTPAQRKRIRHLLGMERKPQAEVVTERTDAQRAADADRKRRERAATKETA